MVEARAIVGYMSVTIISVQVHHWDIKWCCNVHGCRPANLIFPIYRRMGQSEQMLGSRSVVDV